MKLKVTAALLACFLLLASLSACNRDNENDDETSANNIPMLGDPSSGTTTADPSKTSEPDVTTTDPAATTTDPAVTTTEPPAVTTDPAATTSNPTVTTTEPPAVTTDPVNETTFTACDETVYVIASALNLRTSPAMGDNIYNQVTMGTALRRTGYNETWSKVIHEDKEYYVSSKYVATEDPNAEVVFTARYETVYITASLLNIRENPSTTATIYATVTKGTEVIRIGYSEDWSKIMYDGKILYAGSKYLAIENPNTEAPAETTTAANP